MKMFVIAGCVVKYLNLLHISSGFSSNPEAFESELLDNVEEMCLYHTAAEACH